MNDHPHPDDSDDHIDEVLDDAEPEGHVRMSFFGYHVFRAPDGSTTWEDLEHVEAFPPKGWELVTMLPSDGSDPTDRQLRELAHRTLHGDVQASYDVGKLHVLMVGRGDPSAAEVHQFDPEDHIEEDETQ